MQMAQNSLSDQEYRQAFPVEYIEETSLEKDVIDDPGIVSDTPEESRGDASHSPEDLERLVQEEEDLLEGLPIPGVPADEKQRRSEWLKLPRKARVAIRRMHTEFGHCPRTVLEQILRASKSSKEMLNAAEISNA